MSEDVTALTKNKNNETTSIQFSSLTFKYLVRHTKCFNYFIYIVGLNH